MNKETVTVKKKNPPIVKLIVAAILFFLLTRLGELNIYLYAFTVFLMMMLALYGVDFLVEMIRYFSDKEKQVVIRKSSMENVKAKEIEKETNNVACKYAFLANAAVALLVATIITLSAYRKQDEVTQACAFLMGIIIGTIVYGRIVKHGKAVAGKICDRIDRSCDPVLVFDAMELRRLDILSGDVKATIFFNEMMAAYFQDDYETMYSKARAFDRVNMDPAKELFRIEFEGSACIKAGNPEAFNQMSKMLKQIEAKNAHNRQMIELCASTRKRWDVLIAWKTNEQDKLYSVAVDVASETRHFQLMRMEYTYILAEMQERKGFIQYAEDNYKIVAENAGNMAVRNKALEGLDRINKRYED